MVNVGTWFWLGFWNSIVLWAGYSYIRVIYNDDDEEEEKEWGGYSYISHLWSVYVLNKLRKLDIHTWIHIH